MVIALYAPPQNGHNREELLRIVDTAAAHGIECRVNSDAADGMPSYSSLSECCDAAMVVSYGGDGTFLECVHLAESVGLPVLGINSGRLGFLASVPQEGIDKAMEAIKAGRYNVGERSMLSVEGNGMPSSGSMAFNELTIHRGRGPMISVEVDVDGEMVGRYWGDGVILSTQSGSTAYSLSAGGPIVAPGCQCLLISPIAPHNLTMRPVVIPDSCEVSFRVGSRGGVVSVSLDNNDFILPDGSRLTARKSERKARLVNLHGISFYETLRNKMMWGIDNRNDK